MTDDKKKGIPKKAKVEEAKVEEKIADEEIIDLDISSEKSLHRPLKIRVEGKVYTSVVLSKKLFDGLAKLQDEAAKGNQDAPYEQIKRVFGVPKIILYKQDMRDINVISELVTGTILESELYRTDKEKKVEGPGEKSSVS